MTVWLGMTVYIPCAMPDGYNKGRSESSADRKGAHHHGREAQALARAAADSRQSRFLLLAPLSFPVKTSGEDERVLPPDGRQTCQSVAGEALASPCPSLAGTGIVSEGDGVLLVLASHSDVYCIYWGARKPCLANPFFSLAGA